MSNRWDNNIGSLDFLPQIYCPGMTAGDGSILFQQHKQQRPANQGAASNHDRFFSHQRDTGLVKQMHDSERSARPQPLLTSKQSALIERVQAGMGSSSYSPGPLGESEVCLRSFARKLRALLPEARSDAKPAGYGSAR